LFGAEDMKIDDIKYHPIGIIHSPYKEIEGMPIQPCAAKGMRGTEAIRNYFNSKKYDSVE
jgi:tRNA (Thr-GGU) A37 N-methylase